MLKNYLAVGTKIQVDVQVNMPSSGVGTVVDINERTGSMYAFDEETNDVAFLLDDEGDDNLNWCYVLAFKYITVI
jgi:hypothetical protein